MLTVEPLTVTVAGRLARGFWPFAPSVVSGSPLAFNRNSDVVAELPAPLAMVLFQRPFESMIHREMLNLVLNVVDALTAPFALNAMSVEPV